MALVDTMNDINVEGYTRVNHTAIYGLFINNTPIYEVYINNGTVPIYEWDLQGAKFWFRAVNKTNAISIGECLSGNSPLSTACATLSRTHPIRIKTITFSWSVTSERTSGTSQDTYFTIWGRNADTPATSQYGWVKLGTYGEQCKIPPGSSSASGSSTVTVNSNNFFTEFKFVMYNDGFPIKPGNAGRNCRAENIRITSYDIDRSLEA